MNKNTIEKSKAIALCTIAYDGTNYAGWQIQPQRTTVQGVLQNQLRRLFQTDIPLSSCSRTDAGVHALCQKAMFTLPSWPPIPLPQVKKAINNSISDIYICNIEEKESSFHARYDASEKNYVYLLYLGKEASPFLRNYYWQISFPLDIHAMKQAATFLVGTHDFTRLSVKKKQHYFATSIRTIYGIRFYSYDKFLIISVRGDGFLYKMVRRIIGFLVAVGKGQLQTSDGSSLLREEEDLNIAFDTAKAQGLYLENICYAGEGKPVYSPQLPFLQFVLTSKNKELP